MEAFGYTLKGKAERLSTDFTPSLIGVGVNASEPSPQDMYFERIEFTDRTIASISKTDWVNYDSAPLTGRDPILKIRRPDGSGYYIPLSELQELAAFHQDDETFELLAAL